MSRYIEAESLIDHLYEEEFTIICPLDEVSGVINDEPTADVQPVQHGRWIEQRDMEEFDFKIYKCSVCEKINEIDIVLDDISNYKYCPNCGSYNGESK